jgi:signal transduction histidine kinase
MYDIATRMNKLKSIMLASTSHEFRNPIAGIISMLNVISKGIK